MTKFNTSTTNNPLRLAEISYATSGAPSWFPFHAAMDALLQIPTIPAPVFDHLPQRATAYDKRGKIPDKSLLLHGYIADRKLSTQLSNPESWIARFSGFAGVISPDFSICYDDPLDRRIFSVRMSRAIGALYALHGITVIPNIRWGDSRDFSFAFEGVEIGSIVAVSNHGLWRTPKLRQGFLAGLPRMIERLHPTAVYVHGTMNHPLVRELALSTCFVHLPSDATLARRGVR